MQLAGGVVLVVVAAITYKVAIFSYSILRNSLSLRHLPGPRYGFFLGVISQFAKGRPITRCLVHGCALKFIVLLQLAYELSTTQANARLG